MRIADSIKSALIIDNKEDEVEGLQSVLRDEGIYYTFHTPTELDGNEQKIKNHQIIFMDFSLDDTKTNPVENIALIRKALKKICQDEFGSYGLILWTKHLGESENVKLFKEKLSIDAKNKGYITPLFVVGLDKLKYIQKGYASLWEDLNTELLKDKAALFFFNWRYSVDIASDKALKSMYQLVPDYETQAQRFPYLLYQMAENYSGVPVKDMNVYEGMYKDAYRAFDELLYSDLISKQSGLENCFPKQIEKPDCAFEEEIEQMAQINSKLLLDLSMTDQNIVMPGNVYQIVKNNNFLQLDITENEFLNKNNELLEDGFIPIAIELTPPCDFSHKKVSSRLIGGFMINCPKEEKKIKSCKGSFKGENKYTIWPVTFQNVIKFICFDFRNIYVEEDKTMMDASSYKLLFMVKHRLFSDILQKFSSHAARLGLSIIQP